MQTTLALAALASVAFAAQAAPNPPPGCSPNYNGEFQITIVNGSSVIRRDLQPRSTCGQPGLLTAKLINGTLTDTQGRIGNIVSNEQFQFDPYPGQAGAIYTSGWSVCANGSLAIAGSTIFYSCKSGNFANLYDKSIASYCLPVFINVLPCSGSSNAGQKPDGQPTATTAVRVTQISDGQAQGPTAVAPVTQIGDGQLQGPPAVTQISDGQLQIPTGVPVTQISDGQLQAPTAPAAKPAGKPANQISDGQVQVPTKAGGAPVSQIPDGQLQAPTKAPASSSITQAPTGAPVAQISDGQIQATPAATTTKAVSNATISAKPSTTSVVVSAGHGLLASSFSALIVGFAAVFLL